MHPVKTFKYEDYFLDLENGPIHGEIKRNGYQLNLDTIDDRIQFNVNDAQEPGRKCIIMRGNQGHWTTPGRFDIWFDQPTENVALQCDPKGQTSLLTAFDEKGTRVAFIIIDSKKDIDLSGHKITSVVYEGAPEEWGAALYLNYVKYD